MKIQLTQYEYATLINAVRKEYIYSCGMAATENLTEEDVKDLKSMDMISWKESSQLNSFLLTKLEEFTSEINFREVSIILLSKPFY